MDNNIYKKIFVNKIWEYIYVVLISFLFYSSILCNLVWNDSFNILHLIFVEYHDEISLSLALIVFGKELAECLFEIFESIKNKNKDCLKSIIAIILVILVYVGTRNKRYFVYALIIYCSKYLNYKKICSIYIYSKFFGIITWTFLFLTNNLIAQENSREALSFGMISYNDVSFTLIFVLLVLWILFKDKARVWLNIVAILLCIFNIFFIKSRTGIVMNILFIAMINIYYFIKISYKKIENIIFEYLPVIMTVLAIALGLAYRAIYLKTDYVPLIGFSSRFADIALQLHYGGISLFPSDKLEWLNLYFDNTYANLMFKRGLICTFIFMYVAIKNNYLIIKNKDKTMIFVAIFIYIYAQMEYLVKGEILILLLMYYFSNKYYGDKDEQ